MANSGGSGGGGAKGVRMGAAFVELFADDNKLIRGLKSAEARFKNFGSKLVAAGAGPLAAGGGLFGGAVAALQSVATEVGAIGTAGQAFGMTAEKASELFGILKASGSDTRDATEGLVTLGGRVKDALSGSGEEAKQLFDGLGVSAQSFAGLDPADQFFKLHDALRQVQDPAERVQLLLKAVGEDTGKNLINTLSMTTEQLKASGKQFTITSAEMDTAKRASAAMSQVSASLSNAWNRVVLAVAEAVPFETIAATIGKVVGQVREFVSANAGVIRTVLLVAGGVGAAGAAVVGIGAAFSAAGAVLGTLAAGFKALFAVAGALVSPLGLVAAAVGTGVYLWTQYTESGQSALASVKDAIGQAAAFVKGVWGGVADALSAGDLSLAWSVALAGVKVAWAEAVVFLTEKWNGFKGLFVDGWHDTVAVFKDLWNDATSYIATAMAQAIGGVAKALDFLGEYNPLAGVSAVMADTVKIIEQDRRRASDAIGKALNQEQQARDAARANDLAGARGDAAAARGEFDRLKAAAAAAAEASKRPAVADVARAAQSAVSLAGAAQGGGAGGGFGSLGSRFGAGESGFKQMVGLQKDQVKATAKVEQTIKDLASGLAYT